MASPSDTIYAIHIPSATNLGDALSTPVLYFNEFRSRFRVTILSIAARDRISAIPQDAPVLVGGGGLLAGKPEWDQAMETVLERTRFAVAWGVGLNRSRKAASLPARVPPFLARFRHYGLRDWLPDVPWVPCVSSMAPELAGMPASPRRAYGVYLHGSRTDRMPEGIAAVAGDDNTMTNFGGSKSFAAVVDFLATSEVVVTNSFHGMYWATLLRRPVVVFDAFSEKFVRTRWPAAIFEDHASLNEARQAATVYPEALDQAREANRSFFEKVWTDLSRELPAPTP